MGVRGCGQADETGADLPEFGRSGLVVAALGGFLRLAVCEVSTGHLLEIERKPGVRMCRGRARSGSVQKYGRQLL